MADEPKSHSVLAPPVASPLAVTSNLTMLGEGEVVDAEGVRHRRMHQTRRWLRWLVLLFQVVVAGIVAWGFYQIPLGAFPGPIQNWKNPIVIFVLICFIGKTLLDTLFYDHYEP